MKTLIHPKIKMTEAKRRKAVEIARDVIAQLKAKRYQATNGMYLDPSSEIFRFTTYNADDSFQQLLKQYPDKKCNVCGIGSLFISFVDKENEITVEQAESEDDELMINTLSKYFDPSNLRLVEAVFEGFDFPSDVYEGDEYYHRLEIEALRKGPDSEAQKTVEKISKRIGKYYARYDNANDRLRAIMLNVVRNNGEFRLPKK